MQICEVENIRKDLLSLGTAVHDLQQLVSDTGKDEDTVVHILRMITDCLNARQRAYGSLLPESVGILYIDECIPIVTDQLINPGR